MVVGSPTDLLGEEKAACGEKTDCDGEAIVEADDVPDPFSQRSASSLKLFDPTTDDGEAWLSFLGGANGKSFGLSVVGIFSASVFDEFSSGVFSANRDVILVLLLVSLLLLNEADEPTNLQQREMKQRNVKSKRNN